MTSLFDAARVPDLRDLRKMSALLYLSLKQPEYPKLKKVANRNDRIYHNSFAIEWMVFIP
jgi:hypothetical protein